MGRISIALSVCALSSSLAGTLSAQQEQTASTAAATVLFDEAIKLMDQHRYAEACPKLARSHELAPSGGTLLNLAKCYEANGQIASAWIRYREAAERAAAANKPEPEKLAREAADKLAASVSTLAISVKQRTEGLEIRRDGEIVNAAQLGIAAPIDPGSHVIEATAPGYVAWRSTISVTPSKQGLTVEVPRLEVYRPPPPPPDAPGSSGVDVAPTKNHQKTIGIGLGAAGLVGLGLGTYFGLRASSKNDEAGQHCRTETLCDARGLELDDQARSAATASTIAFVAGGALIAAGAVMYFTAPGDDRTAVGILHEPSGARLMLRRSF